MNFTPFLIASMLLSTLSSVSQAQSIVLENFEGEKNFFGVSRETVTVFEGASAGRFDAMKGNTAPPQNTGKLAVSNWSGKALTFQLHSNTADGGQVVLMLFSDNPATEGGDYYRLTIPVNWTGWKGFRVLPPDLNRGLAVARTPRGWNAIDSMQFWGIQGGTPQNDLVLLLDDFRLEPLSDAEKTTTPTPAPVTVAPAASTWKNDGFEAPSKPVNPSGTTAASGAQVSGELAEGWSDNSTWADVTVAYAPDKENPHGGTSAQKIEINAVRKGAVQVVQGVNLKKDHTYRGEVWLRSLEPMVVQLHFQKTLTPYTSYGSKMVQLTTDWQKVETTFRAPEEMRAYFMLRATGAGTFWADDAQFEDMSQIASTLPAHTGNLLANASFEAGIGNGWHVRVRGAGDLVAAAKAEYSDPRPLTDQSTAADGQRSLRVEIPAKMFALVSSPLVAFNFGRPHAASIAIKASRPCRVELELEKSSLKSTVEVGTSWGRVALNGVLPYATNTRLWIRSAPDNEPLTLWLDGAMLEEQATPSPHYRSAYPLELTISAPHNGAIFFDGQSATLPIRTAGTVPAGAQLRLSTLDLYGQSQELPALMLPVETITIAPDKARPRGMWKVRTQVFDAANQAISAPVEQIFARLPRPKKLTARQAEKSFFGVHIPLNPEFIQIAQATGARWVRLHDASMVSKWAIVEPHKGQWQWIDDGVNAARAAGLNILGMIDGAPAWASKTPRATSAYGSQYNYPDAPGAHENWKIYARRTSEHFKNRINAWEVWNEPWGKGFFSGTAEDYAELLRLAAPEIKAGNPAAEVVGIDGITSQGEWNERAVAAAPPKFYDLLSFHDYNPALYGGPVSVASRDAKFFRDIQNRHGKARPLWGTEGGAGDLDSWYYSAGGLSPRAQLAQIVRFDVTYMGAGVQKFFYYTLHGDPPQGSGSLNAVEHDRSIKPLLAARAVLASLVDGAQCLGRTEPIAGVDEYSFSNGVRVLWSYAGGEHRIGVPKGVRALDVLGNALTSKELTLGPEPIYFVR